jgi:hypothetical protein
MVAALAKLIRHDLVTWPVAVRSRTRQYLEHTRDRAR